MNSIQHSLCNDVLRRPPGMTEDQCRDLHILREPDRVVSFWIPEPAELQAIIAGEPIYLSIYGRTHPPLHIGVVRPSEVEGDNQEAGSDFRARALAMFPDLEGLEGVAFNEALATIISSGFGPMATAPKDGTTILLHIHHANFRVAPDHERRQWESNAEGRWTDHNEGGWVWSGMSGTPVAWKPVENEESESA